jgi:hypothetical protein
MLLLAQEKAEISLEVEVVKEAESALQLVQQEATAEDQHLHFQTT